MAAPTRSKTVRQTKTKKEYLINIHETTQGLLEQEDTTGTKTITIDDKGPKKVKIKGPGKKQEEIEGVYEISNLLQETALANDIGEMQGQAQKLKRAMTMQREPGLQKGKVEIPAVPAFFVLKNERITENPLKRLLRVIQNNFWPALIRTIDKKGLEKILVDTKSQEMEAPFRIFVPFYDEDAFKYFKTIKAADLIPERQGGGLTVLRLPKVLTPEYVKTLDNMPGILSLGLQTNRTGKIADGFPFVVAGGRFNEMYNWDSYFCFLGYERFPEFRCLGISVINNFVYEIENYGKVLNGNRTYYLTRTQPPFFAEMIVTAATKIDPKTWSSIWELVSPIPEAKYNGPTKGNYVAWIWRCLNAAIKEYSNVWEVEPRYVPETGLSRYYDEGIGIPPECEPGHFDTILQHYAEKHGLSLDEFTLKYKTGEIVDTGLDAYFISDRAMRETGHDTTYRFVGVAEQLCTIDLNALLYKYETNIAFLMEKYFLGRFRNSDDQCYYASYFRNQARKRRDNINKYMWSEERGLFFDYNFVEKKQRDYETPTVYWALWAGLASEQQAKRLQENLELFEEKGGLAASTLNSRGAVSKERPGRQWDYPIGWAPHQVLAWRGLAEYGFKEDAKRLAYRWLYMIIKEFIDFNGVIPEKYNVVEASHKVHFEYGNVGTDFEFVAKEGFGWVNASITIGVEDYLTQREKNALPLKIEPDVLFNDTER